MDWISVNGVKPIPNSAVLIATVDREVLVAGFYDGGFYVAAHGILSDTIDMTDQVDYWMYIPSVPSMPSANHSDQ